VTLRDDCIDDREGNHKRTQHRGSLFKQHWGLGSEGYMKVEDCDESGRLQLEILVYIGGGQSL